MPLTLYPALCLLLLLLLAIGTELASAGDDTCSEGLGLCGQDCDERCRARHDGRNPQGSCDYTIKPPLCTCLYSCGGSPPAGPPEGPGAKVCHVGLGMCSIHCPYKCCNTKCSAQFNKGQGYCDTGAGVSLCQCSYSC